MNETKSKQAIDGYAEANEAAAKLVVALTQAGLKARITDAKVFPNNENAQVVVVAHNPDNDDHVSKVVIHAVHEERGYLTRHRIELTVCVPWTRRNCGVKSRINWKNISQKAIDSIVERSKANLDRIRHDAGVKAERDRQRLEDIKNATAISDGLDKRGYDVETRFSAPWFTLVGEKHDIEVHLCKETIYLKCGHNVRLKMEAMPVTDPLYCEVRILRVRQKLDELFLVAQPGARSGWE